jgi:hypothetical protein
VQTRLLCCLPDREAFFGADPELTEKQAIHAEATKDPIWFNVKRSALK